MTEVLKHISSHDASHMRSGMEDTDCRECKESLNLPAPVIHSGSFSAYKWVGATTRVKKAKTKIVVTLRHPRNTERPVPAWYISKRSGNTINGFIRVIKLRWVMALHSLGLFVANFDAADVEWLLRIECNWTLEGDMRRIEVTRNGNGALRDRIRINSIAPGIGSFRSSFQE